MCGNEVLAGAFNGQFNPGQWGQTAAGIYEGLMWEE